MNSEKEKLRELLNEDKSTSINQLDVEAVSRMLSVLEKEDRSVHLSGNFSAGIIQKIVQKQKRENRFSWFGYLAGVLGIIVSLIISLLVVDFKIDLGFLKGISSYSGLFLFGIAFILVLNFIEKRIIRFSSE